MGGKQGEEGRPTVLGKNVNQAFLHCLGSGCHLHSSAAPPLHVRHRCALSFHFAAISHARFRGGKSVILRQGQITVPKWNLRCEAGRCESSEAASTPRRRPRYAANRAFRISRFAKPDISHFERRTLHLLPRTLRHETLSESVSCRILPSAWARRENTTCLGREL
jgi:hypothetical protein